MPVSCELSDLSELVKCTACVPATDDVLIYSLCAWVNGGADPAYQGFLLESEGGYINLSDGGRIIIQVESPLDLTQYLTDENGNIVTDENGNPIILDI